MRSEDIGSEGDAEEGVSEAASEAAPDSMQGAAARATSEDANTTLKPAPEKPEADEPKKRKGKKKDAGLGSSSRHRDHVPDQLSRVKSRVVCKSERKLLDASVRLPWRPPWARGVRGPGNGARSRPQ